MTELITAFTGHRPPKLGLTWSGTSAQDARVLGDVRNYLRTSQPTKIISGMALGIDQIAAYAAILEHVPFIAAVPFPEQPNRWPIARQKQYGRLLAQAEEVVYVSDRFHPYAMQLRNIWMVDRVPLITAYWDGSPGGTRNCVEYAESKQVLIHNRYNNVWPPLPTRKERST